MLPLVPHTGDFEELRNFGMCWTSIGAVVVASGRRKGTGSNRSSKCCFRCMSRRPCAGTPHARSAREANDDRIACGERNRRVWMASEPSNARNRQEAMELRTLGA